MKNRLKMAALAVAFALPAAPAAAQQVINLTIASSHPVQVPWVSAMANHIVPEIDRRLAADGNKYKINWRQAYGGVLYKANATLTSITDGIADMGWVFTNLESARMPLAQVSTLHPGRDRQLPADGGGAQRTDGHQPGAQGRVGQGERDLPRLDGHRHAAALHQDAGQDVSRDRGRQDLRRPAPSARGSTPSAASPSTARCPPSTRT